MSAYARRAAKALNKDRPALAPRTSTSTRRGPARRLGARTVADSRRRAPPTTGALNNGFFKQKYDPNLAPMVPVTSTIPEHTVEFSANVESHDGEWTTVKSKRHPRVILQEQILAQRRAMVGIRSMMVKAIDAATTASSNRTPIPNMPNTIHPCRFTPEASLVQLETRGPMTCPRGGNRSGFVKKRAGAPTGVPFSF